jgi:hypothetical protein
MLSVWQRHRRRKQLKVNKYAKNEKEYDLGINNKKEYNIQ